MENSLFDSFLAKDKRVPRIKNPCTTHYAMVLYKSQARAFLSQLSDMYWPKAGRTWQAQRAATVVVAIAGTIASLQVSGFKVPLTTVHELNSILLSFNCLDTKSYCHK